MTACDDDSVSERLIQESGIFFYDWNLEDDTQQHQTNIMNRSSIQTLKLPVGTVPDWENVNTQDGVELKSVKERCALRYAFASLILSPESYVILQSLKQC